VDDKVPDSLKRKRILVIDDQGSIRVVFSSFLKDIGFNNVDCAMDGKDALKLMHIYPYDLVICDWVMPKLSGMELLQMLRQSEQASAIPFIMVTSSSDSEDVQLAIAAGVTDYIIKPFQPVQLKQKVLQHLEKSQYKGQKLLLKSASQSATKAFDADKAERDMDTQEQHAD